MIQSSRRTVAASVLVVTLWGAFGHGCFAGESEQAALVLPERVAAGIDAALAYILRNCDKDGRFTYRDHVDPDRKYDRKYNLLRHAGTMYSLGMAHERRPTPGIAEVMNRSGLYLARRIEPLEHHPDALAVWSDPKDLGDLDNPESPAAKLGGAGLGLVGLTSLERIRPRTVPREILVGLGEFVLFMQQEGEFRSKYFEVHGRPVFSTWRSLYYPGEAMLGLARLNRHHPDPKWLDTCWRGLARLAAERKDQEKPPADHWVLLATADLLPLHNDEASKVVPREVLIRHAVQICRRILDDQVDTPPAFAGSFHTFGMITPTAIRLEGILAMIPALPPEQAELREELIAASHRGVDFLLRNQIPDGDVAGGFPRAAAKAPDTPKYAAYNKRVGEIRIDYVQHALSALISYERILLAPRDTARTAAAEHPHQEPAPVSAD